MKAKKVPSNPKLEKADKIIKRIFFILLFAFNAIIIGLLIYVAVGEMNQPPVEEGIDLSGLGFAFVYALIGGGVGLIGNAILVLLALSGGICVLCNKGDPLRMAKIFQYSICIGLPFFAYAFIMIIGNHMMQLI